MTTRSPSSSSTSIDSPRARVRRARDVERSEHGVLGAALGAAVGDELDERRDAERVRQEDELLARVVALLAGRGEELDAGEPLVALQADLLDEGVEVADGGLGDLAQPRVRRVLVAREHVGQQLGMGRSWSSGSPPSSGGLLWSLRRLHRVLAGDDPPRPLVEGGDALGVGDHVEAVRPDRVARPARRSPPGRGRASPAAGAACALYSAACAICSLVQRVGEALGPVAVRRA